MQAFDKRNSQTLMRYEIHADSSDPALQQPAIYLQDDRLDGALSKDSQILGTYLHGVLELTSACDGLLRIIN